MILEETECGIIEKRRDSPRFCFVNYVQLKSLVNFTWEKRFPCATSNCFISSEDCKLLLQPSIRNRNSRIIIFKVKASTIPFSFLKKQAIQPFFKHHKQKHFSSHTGHLPWACIWSNYIQHFLLIVILSGKLSERGPACGKQAHWDSRVNFIPSHNIQSSNRYLDHCNLSFKIRSCVLR